MSRVFKGQRPLCAAIHRVHPESRGGLHCDTFTTQREERWPILFCTSTLHTPTEGTFLFTNSLHIN